MPGTWAHRHEKVPGTFTWEAKGMINKFGKQFYITAAVLIVGIVLVQRVPQGKTMLLQKELAAIPKEFAGSNGVEQPPLDQKIMDVLRADDYIDRVYSAPDKGWVSLFVAYFRNQISGQTIHSPRNCMPGSGWNFTEEQTVTLDLSGKKPLKFQAFKAILVNGEQRLLTYFWYQGRGRFLANEYWDKVYLVLDAIWYNRTDDALVRVLAPLPKGANLDRVDAQIRDFIAWIAPLLQDEYFPPPVGSY